MMQLSVVVQNTVGTSRPGVEVTRYTYPVCSALDGEAESDTDHGSAE